VIADAIGNALFDSQAKLFSDSFRIKGQPAQASPDRLPAWRLKPILCDPKPCIRSAVMTAEPWVSVGQIAAQLGVRRGSIYRWTVKASRRTGLAGCGRWRFPQSMI